MKQIQITNLYSLFNISELQENGQYHYTSLLNNLEDFNPDLMSK